jgi:uncharacterized hydrophobic protein (TIGR00271 family)
VLHLRLIVPAEEVADVVEELRSSAGVAHVVRIPCAETDPPGELVLCDVVREAANHVVERLQQRDVHRRGAITIEALEAVVSDAAERAAVRAPGHGADALVWEEVEARAREEATLTGSFLVFMAVAAVIAAAGVMLDSPILIVGAMVVGPEYGPVSALCVAAVRRRREPAVEAARTLATGLVVAAATALVATALLRVVGVAPEEYAPDRHELTAFISRPDALSAVVAVLAGVVGMLALTEARSGTLIGVLVSVTTIPAVGNIGVATAYGQWSEVAGAATQLAINLAGLLVAGIATLAVQARVTGAASSADAP